DDSEARRGAGRAQLGHGVGRAAIVPVVILVTVIRAGDRGAQDREREEQGTETEKARQGGPPSDSAGHRYSCYETTSQRLGKRAVWSVSVGCLPMVNMCFALQ